MSTKRKALPTTTKDTYNAIKDSLGTVRLKLERDTFDAALIQNLQEIATLASLFSQLRDQSSHTVWSGFIDELDSEGVALWNMKAPASTQEGHASEGTERIAALRTAAFNLVEAGLERKPSTGTLLRIIQLATKTASACAEAGKLDDARSILTTAAKYEGILSESADREEHSQGTTSIVVTFFCCRMETAWKENNSALSEFMSRKAVEHPEFSQLSEQEKRMVSSKHHDIGKAALKQELPDRAAAARVAVPWLQKAFSLVENYETPETVELKISILRSLARAYFLSSSLVPENLARAEAALEELVTSVDTSTDSATPEYQELRWQRLAVLKQRSADDTSLFSAYQSIIENAPFTEEAVTHILQDLRTLSDSKLAAEIHTKFISRALSTPGGQSWVDRLTLSLILHCSKDENHQQSIAILDNLLKDFQTAEFDLPPVFAASCLTLFWKYGSQQFSGKKWTEAADWFLLGSHVVFHTSNPAAQTKCLRKAALCRIEAGEYATASVLVKRCSSTEAATQFLSVLIAVRQGSENEALKAMQTMASAPDFDRKYLLICTQLAHESQMKNVLLLSLQLLLETLKSNKEEETAVQALVLIRCIIRLSLQLLADLGTDRNTLIGTVLRHFRTATDLVHAAAAQDAVHLVSKDISWLWKTAYNTAVQGCEDWPQHEEEIAQLFDMSTELLGRYLEYNPADTDSKPNIHIANAIFSSVCARVFFHRRQANPSEEAIRKLCSQIQDSRTSIDRLLLDGKIEDHDAQILTKTFSHNLSVFLFENIVQLKDWAALGVAMTELTQSSLAELSTFEAVADILWMEESCPTDVLFACLESVLHSSLDKNLLRVDKFARWLRAVCTISLVKGPQQRGKSIDYVEQALAVIEEHKSGENSYPMEERQWLLGSAYNTGIECLQASHLDDAKRWLEAAIVLCRFVPDGRSRADRISDTYTRLLARRSNT